MATPNSNAATIDSAGNTTTGTGGTGTGGAGGANSGTSNANATNMPMEMPASESSSAPNERKRKSECDKCEREECKRIKTDLDHLNHVGLTADFETDYYNPVVYEGNQTKYEINSIKKTLLGRGNLIPMKTMGFLTPSLLIKHGIIRQDQVTHLYSISVLNRKFKAHSPDAETVRRRYGSEIYEDALRARKEIEDYNLSGNYPISIPWNEKSNRVMTTFEMVEYTLCEMDKYRKAFEDQRNQMAYVGEKDAQLLEKDNELYEKDKKFRDLERQSARNVYEAEKEALELKSKLEEKEKQLCENAKRSNSKDKKLDEMKKQLIQYKALAREHNLKLPADANQKGGWKERGCLIM